jgi:hypothetical protein
LPHIHAQSIANRNGIRGRQPRTPALPLHADVNAAA